MRKMKANYSKDRGAATLVTAIISMMFICLCAGFAIDTAKNSYLKSSFTSRAQQTSEVALKNIDSRGSIKEDAAAKVVSEYGASASGTFARDETNAFKGTCTTRTITDWDGVRRDRAMPYIIIRLNTGRAIGATDDVVYTSAGGATPVLVKGVYNPSAKYTVLAAEVHDSSANFMLSMFGMDCQDYMQKVSAISFGSAGDLTP